MVAAAAITHDCEPHLFAREFPTVGFASARAIGAFATVQTNNESTIRNFSGKASTFVVWVISLVLFVVALLAQFGVVRMGAPIAT